MKQKIGNYKEEIIHNLTKLVSYKSVQSEAANNMPFGIACAECLEEALNMAKSYGMKTVNLDNYCGYAEIGEGNDIIGIVGHLDVVPEGNGWNSNPYDAIIKNNRIYGRGTSDDKGAVVASLIALKIIKEMNIPLNKRIRLIMGCNEESGSKCMEYYNKVEEPITLGFTPDAEFPVVNGEKGHLKLIFSCKNNLNIKINGGVVFNAVSDFCDVTVLKKLVNIEKFKLYLDNKNIKYEISENEENYILKVKGKSAHASTPEFGVNAISNMVLALEAAGVQDDLISFYSEYLKCEYDGESLGIKCSDKYGNLTLVNGMIYNNEDYIEGTIDIRVPILIDSKEMAEKIINKDYKTAKIIAESVSDSLYYSEESDLVKSLMTAYRNVTKDYDAKPFTIGGGTYAKSIKNCVAFGCEFVNNENNIHDANESVDINELLLQTELYVNAILELLKV